MLEAAVDALVIIADPSRILFVVLGTVLGLIIGVIPGIGGLVGMSLLLPFTFAMDPYTALAFLVGVQSVVATGDTPPAILFGVPGTAGSAATVLDGHQMAKKGQAGRALGASYAANVIGGLFGAVVLAISIPILRPFMMSVGTPEMLAICLLGLALVVTLSRGAMLKGLLAAALGLLLSTVGDEPQTGELRWTFGSFYLWDGLSLVAVALGLFAVPELIDLGANKKPISRDNNKPDPWQQLEGVRDVFRNWWLVIRCSAIGTLLGSIPGVGANIIDWVAYGYAANSIKDSHKTFGKGDVRGVIASEASNNAKEGGALVPTLAFGVPGSASMAILLGAFLIHGIAPGPEMLDSKLDVTFTLIWTVALANILGAGLCIMSSGVFAKLALVRASIIVPLILSIMVVGAYQSSKAYGDLVVLVAFGVLGWVMKRLDWPRPPLILAFVLGGLVENYLFISQLRYGVEWMLMPVPFVLLCIMAFMLFRQPIMAGWRRVRGTTAPVRHGETADTARPDRGMAFFCDIALLAAVAGLLFYALVSSSGWDLPARLFPNVIAYAGLAAVAIMAAGWFIRGNSGVKSTGHEPLRAVLKQGAWLLAAIVGVRLVGMLPAIILFSAAYMLIEGREKPKTALLILIPYAAALYLLFHSTLHIPWPQSLLGDLVPGLRSLSGRLL
ncbi:tripartite tricarboxylate transporter permease [Halovulum dunhuangense]|uniref:Tripartite tricarboxylate transporter permease n=1 Tax=Halovulum dunhuangense TaxID=1505036 RepID=A0A849L3G3_9RHOB|nr:tripartite tricarboxylate transporter permease [Halovulum dunhuangense]